MTTWVVPLLSWLAFADKTYRSSKIHKSLSLHKTYLNKYDSSIELHIIIMKTFPVTLMDLAI